MPMPNRHEFCGLIASARYYNLRGSWSGSVYRYHPCGVTREGLIFVNHWHVDNHCSIGALTVPDSTLLPPARNPTGGGNPLPSPIDGEIISVWRDGHWMIHGPWESKAERILSQLRTEINEAKASERDRKNREESERSRSIKARNDALRRAHS